MKDNKLMPIADLEKVGVYKDGKFTIPAEQVEALKNGKVTDVIELKDLKGKDINIESLPARLSIVKGEDGKPSLRIDPVYREPMKHPLLSEDESKRLINSEIANLKKQYVDKDGNMQTSVIEYDKETKQFVSFDPRAIKAPEEINGEALSYEKKRKFKEGEVVELADGTEIQLRSSDRKGVRSNRTGLVLSVLLDGGISYLLITGIQRMLGKKSDVEQAYSKGYLEGVKEVQKQIERRIARNPNDKDAVRDLNNAKQEYSKASSYSPAQSRQVAEKDYDTAKKFNSIDTEEGRNPAKSKDIKEENRSNSEGRQLDNDNGENTSRGPRR